MLLGRQKVLTMVKEVQTTAEFKTLISENAIVVVDFYATWCGPCMSFAPKFEALSAEFPNILFIKVNVDQNSELQALYSITSIPSFKIFKDGAVVDSCTGANDAILRSTIKKHV